MKIGKSQFWASLSALDIGAHLPRGAASELEPVTGAEDLDTPSGGAGSRCCSIHAVTSEIANMTCLPNR